MLWSKECVPVRDVEVVKVDIMQEHIDATEIIECEFVVLPIESIPYIFLAENFCEFEQE